MSEHSIFLSEIKLSVQWLALPLIAVNFGNDSNEYWISFLTRAWLDNFRVTQLDSRPLWLVTWLDSSTDLSDSWLDSDSTLMTRDSTRDSSLVTRQRLLEAIFAIWDYFSYLYFTSHLPPDSESFFFWFEIWLQFLLKNSNSLENWVVHITGDI